MLKNKNKERKQQQQKQQKNKQPVILKCTERRSDHTISAVFLHDTCINILQSPKGRDAWAPNKIKTNTVTLTVIIKQIKKKKLI